jgi:hypothetical protein
MKILSLEENSEINLRASKFVTPFWKIKDPPPRFLFPCPPGITERIFHKKIIEKFKVES